MVKKYLCKVLCKILIKIKNIWRHKIKDKTPQQPPEVFYKILQYPQETPVLESIFKRNSNTGVFL